ncbi:MAG TPA: GNAT family N-acetyltransferase [Stellaceae bacterium]|nr:GNAT family N-acetyltransferase [Stellaceae bacterium]
MTVADAAIAGIAIEPMLASDRAVYHEFLHALPESLLYYSLPYRAFLEDLLGCRSTYWLARRNGRIAGVLPIMERDGPWGRVLNSLPYFGSNGGALALDEKAAAALAGQFDRLAGAPGILAATWVSHPLTPSAGPIVAHDLVDERISQFTSLAGGETAISQRIDPSARRNINKARASGVAVSVQNDAFDFLQEVHVANMAEIGGKPKEPDFFAKIPRHFRADEDYRIYVAERSGQPVAALLLFYFNRTVEYFTPVTRAEERNVQPMALILHQAMIDAAARGFAWWNWGGTWVGQTGVWRFKAKWGADERRYRYYVKLNDRGILARSAQELAAAYPGFYVVPYAALEER